MTTSVDQFALGAITRYERAEVSYPQFVLELERAVDLAEEEEDDRAVNLRRAWGSLEMLNSMLENELPSEEQEVEIQADVATFISALKEIGGRDEAEQALDRSLRAQDSSGPLDL